MMSWRHLIAKDVETTLAALSSVDPLTISQALAQHGAIAASHRVPACQVTGPNARPQATCCGRPKLCALRDQIERCIQKMRHPENVQAREADYRKKESNSGGYFASPLLKSDEDKPRLTVTSLLQC